MKVQAMTTSQIFFLWVSI